MGLGKTLVARGVIARAVEHLRPSVPRIDVVYICSNGDIARQNINRLKITERARLRARERITMLPLEAQATSRAKTGINFVSFTPATSFDLKAARAAWPRSALLLYWMLEKAWGIGERQGQR